MERFSSTLPETEVKRLLGAMSKYRLINMPSKIENSWVRGAPVLACRGIDFPEMLLRV